MIDRDLLAYHESGHAVACLVHHVPLEFVTLNETRQGVPYGDVDTTSQLVILLCGGSAERHLVGRATFNVQDVERAALLVRSIRLTSRTDAELRHYRFLADALVSARWQQIVHVARALARRRRLTGDEVTALALEAANDYRIHL